MPAPSLFVGPPSQNASTASIPRIKTDSSDSPKSTSKTQPLNTLYRERPQSNRSSMDDKRTEAVWAEMQNTLDEVELSTTGGGNVFSADHARALEDLRNAQIGLAQAWARSEAEDEAERNEGEKGNGPTVENEELGGMGAVGGGSISGRRRAGSKGTSADAKTQLEEETENDILLARQRRQANDRYFERVNKSVVDVVARLEEVSKKMRSVEMEAQDIWDDNDSLNTADDSL